MSRLQDTDRLLPVFGELLADLRARGYNIGVEEYLRVQQLLELGGAERSPGEIATLLSPVLASNHFEQQQLHELIPQYLNAPEAFARPVEPQSGPATAANELNLHTSGIYKQFAILTVILAVVLGLVFLFVPKRKKATALSDNPPPLVSTDLEPSAPPLPEQAIEPNTNKRVHRGYYLLAFSLPLLLWLLYEWHRRRRRLIGLEEFRQRTTPSNWPLRVPARALELFTSGPLYLAARNLRRRQADVLSRIDVEASVNATINAAGFPTLRQKTTSKVPEYLLLIEKLSEQDHLAEFFSALARALRHEGVFLTAYYFAGNPRVCRRVKDGAVFYLSDLESRHDTHRLLLLCNGDCLIDNITGRLAPWTHLFTFWPERALLTPESLAQFGAREAVLSDMFAVLPATQASLSALSELFESDTPLELGVSGTELSLSSSALSGSPPNIVNNLRRSFPAPLFRWLCACAVHPELSWDLTLQLASLAAANGELLTEENLLALSRLPWFRKGKIPDDLRWELIKELDPELERNIRLFLASLMEHNPPPAGSVAEAGYKLQLAVQRWRIEGSKGRFRELLGLTHRLPAYYLREDSTIQRWISGQKWRLEDARARARGLVGLDPRPHVTGRKSPLLSLSPANIFRLLRGVPLPPFSLETGILALLAVSLSLVSLIAARGLAPRNVVEIAATQPTPTPSPLPDVYLPPEGIPVYTPPPLPEYAPPPLPTPFASNPAPVPIPNSDSKPGPILPPVSGGSNPAQTGTPLPLPPLGSPTPAGPTPTPTPAPTLTLTSNYTGVCLNGPTTLTLSALANAFPAQPNITFTSTAGKITPGEAVENGPTSSIWDLSQLPAGSYSVKAEAKEGKIVKTSSLTVKVYQCQCSASVKLQCPTAPVNKSPFTISAEFPTIDPNWQAKPTVKWHVDGGNYTPEGSMVTLDISGAAGKTVDVTADASNFPAQCPAEGALLATCKIEVGKSLAVLVAEFQLTTPEAEKNGMDSFANRLKGTKARALLEISGPLGPDGKALDVNPTGQRLLSYLVNTHKLDPKNLTVTALPPNKEGQFKVRLYIDPTE